MIPRALPTEQTNEPNEHPFLSLTHSPARQLANGIPRMPLDPDNSPPPPPPPHRDWFFPPAPPFLPSSSSRTLAHRAPFPTTSRSYKPYSLADRRPPPTPRSRSRSPHPSPEQSSPPPPSAPRRRNPRYAGVRPGDARTPSTAAPPAAAPLVPERKSPPASAPTLRWSGLVSAAVGNGELQIFVFDCCDRHVFDGGMLSLQAILLCFGSLLRKNFSLHDQVHHLRVRSSSPILPAHHTTTQTILPPPFPISILPGTARRGHREAAVMHRRHGLITGHEQHVLLREG
jgi:hypothetical protein